MLELIDITKIYKTGDLMQKALDGVSIKFRKNEFASILGPSGSGKTTLLNLIGGLDKYTSGDLIINGISTKKYKDSNWDSYRNHRIGFVFQSYNLISHQTVLQNVMLALTLSGISKKESVERAKKVLDDVGLTDHIYKRPNQLSGGQMQRVAIARALVNDPEIVLADEPTGALDSDTSLQIMELLKNIAKTKLVIMVTHNPDLANEYSTRIIQLKDGKITSDSNPVKNNFRAKSETESVNKTKKTNMSIFTALGLSFNNLMTKKGRTILAAFAGSIGIIGISLILSLSTGFQNYIDKLQEDTLSSYPLTIASETTDMSSLLMAMVGDETESNSTEGKVVEKQYVTNMFSSLTTNDLKSFKRHLEDNKKELDKYISTITYTYSVDPLIYSKSKSGELSKVNPNSMFTAMYGNMGASSLFSSYSSVFTQMTDDTAALEEQYDVLAGRWPEKYDEMIIVLSDKGTIPDLLLYYLGVRDMDELNDIIGKVMKGETVEVTNDPLEFTYEELMDLELKLVKKTDIYKYNKKYNIYEDMSDDEDYINNLYNKAEVLDIVGVVCPKKGVTSMALQTGVSYKKELITHIINDARNTDIVKKQLADEDVDVFSNTRFDSKENNKSMDFDDLISIDKDMLASAFNIKLDENEIKKLTESYMNQISASITTDIVPAKNAYLGALRSLSTDMFNNYIENPKETGSIAMMPGVEVAVIHMNDVDNYVNEFLKSSSAQSTMKDLENKYVIPVSGYETAFSALLKGEMQGYIAAYYVMDQSLSESSENMGAAILAAGVDPAVDGFMNAPEIDASAEVLASKMTEAKMQKEILTKVGELTAELMGKIASSFNVDPDKIAKAFKFDLSEEELSRIMTAMLTKDESGSAFANLVSLGYQDENEPTFISVYFRDFDAKEFFKDFIEDYNKKYEDVDKDKVINYTDVTGILMSSVKKIVNSVSYVLIAFVSISLVVSSIMIGIITYISVLERTKEIGILRAIGASKGNISSIFNAETFITGLLSGLIGVGFTYSVLPFINKIIHDTTGNPDITAVLYPVPALILIVLSIVLTLIGGFIPSKKASKQDPVIALRTE